jgi:hypothetical protein
MSERRKYPRLRVLKSAKIVIGTSSVFDCIVRDLTNCGARIKIPNAANLPEVADITFDGGHTYRPCRLAWRTLNETGVEFLETDRAA